MLRQIYLGLAGVMLFSYATFSFMGWETGGGRRDPVPTVRKARGGGGWFGRSRRSYYGGGSSSWGK